MGAYDFALDSELMCARHSAMPDYKCEVSFKLNAVKKLGWICSERGNLCVMPLIILTVISNCGNLRSLSRALGVI